MAMFLVQKQHIGVTFDLAGIDYEKYEPTSLRVKHYLLRPLGLRLYVDDWPLLAPIPHDGPRTPTPHGVVREVFDIDEAAGWQWKSDTREERALSDTRRCVWDFVELNRTGRRGMPGFLERWGLFDDGLVFEGNMDLDPVYHRFLHVQDLEVHSEHALNILRILSRTEAGEALAFEELPSPSNLVPIILGLDLGYDLSANSPERVWSDMRDAERMEAQRRLAASLLTGFPADLTAPRPRPAWDMVEGRRLVSLAVGVKQIVREHLFSLFLAPAIGVFTCSVCGSPFEAMSERRPRMGYQRFCSDPCRAISKRQANLASWHRNKARWLRKGE